MTPRRTAQVVSILALAAATISGCWLDYKAATIDKAPASGKQQTQKPEPKQSPYVISIWVCDCLMSVIVTTNPPMIANRDQTAPPAMLELMRTLPKSQFLDGRYETRWCPSKI